MIDLSEPLIALSDVPFLEFLPRRRHKNRPGRDKAAVNRSTIYRWAKGGVDGIQLETIRIGNSLCTTEKALLQFFGKLTRRLRQRTRRPKNRHHLETATT
jgi:Protein of unknown function (DUF1580)